MSEAPWLGGGSRGQPSIRPPLWGPNGWGLVNRRIFYSAAFDRNKIILEGMQGRPHPRRANVSIRPLRLILGEGGKEDGAKPSYIFFGRVGGVCTVAVNSLGDRSTPPCVSLLTFFTKESHITP